MNTHSNKYFKPPRFAEFLLKKFFPDEGKFTTVGDINEVYFNHLEQYGKTNAYFWYWKETIGSILPFLTHSFYLGGAMLKNQWKITFRNILKYKTYSFINISGLALGITSCLLIYIWVNHNLEVDRFHKKLNNIYWLNTTEQYGGEKKQGFGSPPAAGPTIERIFPEVISAARLESGGTHEMMFEYKGKKFKENVKFGDLSLFEIFSFKILKGEIPSDYHEKKVLVIDETTAEKYFGTSNPIGKSIKVDLKDDYEVVAVMEDIGDNSTIRFKILAPLETTETLYKINNYTRTWNNTAFQTYLLLSSGTDYKEFSKKIEKLARVNYSKSNLDLYLYPFRDIYLYIYNVIDDVRLFSMIALLILLIACINFMNLSTARSTKRAKEVGLRKVIGAEKKQLIVQFFSEAMFLTILSMIVALAITAIMLPYFNELTNNSFGFSHLFSKSIITGLILITVFTGFISGIYPAIVLSSFQPIKILRGTYAAGQKGKSFRNILVVLQFSFSFFLIVSTLITIQQHRYIIDKDLGFKKDQIITVQLKGNLLENPVSLKTEIMKIPEIKNSTLTSHSLTGIYTFGSGWTWEGKDPNIEPSVTYLNADSDFLNTFKIKLSEGMFFQNDGNQKYNVLVNEAFVKEGKIKNPVGMVLHNMDENLTVIGVVKDFNFRNLYSPVGPLIIYSTSASIYNKYRYINLEVEPGNIKPALAKLEEVYNSFNPEYPFEYTFLSEDFSIMYNGMERESDIIKTFTLLAILISCLGLIGLASFMAEQKSKEIGIRKVLGSSVSKVITLFVKEFTILIVFSFIIAAPVSYYLMQKWLEDFPYRISLSPLYFVLAGMITLIIALISIFYVVQKAAYTNPVETLKSE